MKVFLLDNYDSFTYNLLQYLEELGAEVAVARNDRLTPEEILAAGYERLVVSPGPGTPDAAGITLDLIDRIARDGRSRGRGRDGGEEGVRAVPPLLGVCLGHQAIGQAFGAVVARAPTLMHGKTSPIQHDGCGVFRGLPNPFPATRYHSLAVDPDSVPECLEVSARGPGGVIMGLRHRTLPIEGVQFHPESILTHCGKRLLANFLEGDEPTRGAAV